MLLEAEPGTTDGERHSAISASELRLVSATTAAREIRDLTPPQPYTRLRPGRTHARCGAPPRVAQRPHSDIPLEGALSIHECASARFPSYAKSREHWRSIVTAPSQSP